MSTENTRELVEDVISGRMSRRDFVKRAIALGMSVSGITAVLAATGVPARAQVSGYDLLFSPSPNRSGSSPLAGKTVAGNIYVFTSPDTGVYRVRFYLDDPTMVRAPRRIEGSAPYDFAGGTASMASPFNTATLPDGSHTITAAVELTAGGTEVVHASFTVANNSGTTQPPDQVHLAWVGAPSTTLTVVWRTRNTATPSVVQYRRAGSSAWQQKSGVQRTSGTTGKLHQVDLSGLTPSTAYEYRVGGDGGTWGEVHVTRTAPVPGPADFDVVYFADTGLVGRADGLTTGTRQVIDEIAAMNPLLVLPGGDYAYYDTDKRYGTLENTIDAWFDQVQPVATKAPMMPTYGNHEVLLGEGYKQWANRFPTPQGWNGRRAYSFDVGDVHFVSIFAVYGRDPLTAEQVSWIEGDIAAARAAGRRWIIPYMHVSAFADGTNHPSNTALRAQLGPIFERNGIKIVLSSHDQAYERTYPLTDIGGSNTPTSTSKSCYTMDDGVTWVKISPGGKLSTKNAGFSRFATNPPPAWTAYRNNTLHVFSKLSVSASGSIRLETYGVKGDGTPPVVIDAFQYTSDGCGPSEPPEDITAPAAVSSFAATLGDGRVDLSWNNPSDADFAAVRVMRSTSGHAAKATDTAGHTKVYEGTGTTHADDGLVNGTKYYYTAFAKDGAGNWSEAATADATPKASPASDTVQPEIAALRPKSGSKVRDRTPAIVAVVRDDQTKLARGNIEFHFDGRRKRTFSYNEDTNLLSYQSERLAYGRHSVKVVATDAAGNRAARTWRFMVVR